MNWHSRFALLSTIVTLTALGASPRSDLTLEPVVKGLKLPIAAEVAPGEPERLYLVEQKGRILVWEKGTLAPKPLLDITSKVRSGGEMGLLGLAFHPKFATNHRFYVDYTTERPGLTSVISELTVGSAAEKELLHFDQPYVNHNGGQLAFGPDGYLYIGVGDGGSGGDPHGNGQNLGAVLGKILRLDVDRPAPYAPPDNPFVGRAGARPEIFAYGMRNPWRFSFDPATKLLYVGDVGQNKLEEVDIVEKGKNYGWNAREGSQCYKPKRDCASQGLEAPIYEYPHESSDNCIIGGVVYRGTAMPALVGHYIFGDNGSGKIWELFYDPKARKVTSHSLLFDTGEPLSSFGIDGRGEPLVVSLAGKVSRIVPKPKAEAPKGTASAQ